MKKKMISMLLSFSLLAGMAAGCAPEEEEKPDSGAAEEKTAETEPTGTGEYPTTGEEYEIYYIAQSETGGQVQNLLEIVDMYKEQVNPNFSMTIEYITKTSHTNTVC